MRLDDIAYLIQVFIILSLCGWSRGNLTAQVQAQLLEQINKIIQYDTEISFDDVPGFSLGVIDGDSSYIYHFGSAHRDTLTPLSDSSIFEIGGLTKVFTSLLFNRLEDLNLISRQQKLNSFLSPDEQNKALDQITLVHLITHTSGLISLPNNLASKETSHNNRYSNYQKTDLLDYFHGLNQYPSKFGKYVYSHTNYALIEIAIERATGKQFGDLMDEYVLDPLHLKDSFLSTAAGHKKSVTPGFSRSGRPTETWRFASFAASEGLKSSPRDLLHFIQRMMLGSDDLSRAFARGLSLHQRIPRAKKTYVADAWHAFTNKRYPNIYLHSGKTDGHAASIGFIETTETAVVLMTNATVKMDGLAMMVLRLINNNWKRK